MYHKRYSPVNDRKHELRRYKRTNKPIVYVLQELPGTKAGSPKINIMSASQAWKF